MNADGHDFVIYHLYNSHKSTLEDKDLIGIANTWHMLNKGRIEREQLVYLVSTSILYFYLGNAWSKRNIFLRSSGITTIPEILKPDLEDVRFLKGESVDSRTPRILSNKTIKAIKNTMGLANTLYNLQNIRGFEKKVKEYRNENVEAFFAELQSAQILRYTGAYLEFPEPAGKRALDYDLIAELPNKVVVACDAKCKVESDLHNPNAIVNTIRKARDQLPKNMPTIVFVKVPESWAESGKLYSAFSDLIRGALRNTTRVSAVVVFKAQFRERGNEYKYDMSLKQFQNPQAARPVINLQSIFPDSEQDLRHWKSLYDVIG